jgi:hypothetical protein
MVHNTQLLSKETCWVTLVTHPQSLKPLLDCEELDEATLNAIGGQQDIFYEEPDLSRRVEGMDYFIRYGASSDEDSE